MPRYRISLYAEIDAPSKAEAFDIAYYAICRPATRDSRLDDHGVKHMDIDTTGQRTMIEVMPENTADAAANP